jgi:hypothetical protein
MRTIRDAETAELEVGVWMPRVAPRQVRQEAGEASMPPPRWSNPSIASPGQASSIASGQSSLHHWVGNIARIHNLVQHKLSDSPFAYGIPGNNYASASMLTLADRVRIA